MFILSLQADPPPGVTLPLGRIKIQIHLDTLMFIAGLFILSYKMKVSAVLHWIGNLLYFPTYISI